MIEIALVHTLQIVIAGTSESLCVGCSETANGSPRERENEDDNPSETEGALDCTEQL